MSDHIEQASQIFREAWLASGIRGEIGGRVDAGIRALDSAGLLVGPVVGNVSEIPIRSESDVIEQAARAMADDWDPDRDPFLLAMFRDYANTLAAAGLLAHSHVTPAFTTEQEIESLASEIHEAYAYQYDECDHGTYAGGAMHGEPYSMCRINAERIIRRRSTPPVAATCGYRFPLPSWAGEVQMDRCVCVLATNHDGAHTCSHATPPVAATEAVSGYTSHGHRITGVVQTGRPASVARCGGPGLCAVCSLEASMATNERHG